MSATIIRNGRVIDPANKRDEMADLLIVDGKIAPLSNSQLSTLNPKRSTQAISSSARA